MCVEGSFQFPCFQFTRYKKLVVSLRRASPTRKKGLLVFTRLCYNIFGVVAQWQEHHTVDVRAAGSSPVNPVYDYKTVVKALMDTSLHRHVSKICRSCVRRR
jgi:hypothetical protein